jgi:hypothetical protein
MVSQDNGTLRGEQFFPRFKTGGTGGTFEIFVSGKSKVDAEEGDIEIFCENFSIFRFTVGFSPPQMVVEVDRRQFVVKTALEFPGKQKRGGTVGTAGKSAKDAARGKSCKKLL